MTCHRARCDQPLSARRVVLINANGDDGRTCGPYCDHHTDDLLGILIPVYAFGGPAYRIEEDR